MRDYTTDLMFMLNGDGDLGEKSKRLFHAISEIKSVTNCGLFASDCLVTWAKSTGFLDDRVFVDAVQKTLAGNTNDERALRGILWRLHVVCWAADHCRSIEGDYAELGCYAGNTARIVVDYVNFAALGKTYWLYDLFENEGDVSERLSLHSNSLYAATVEKFRDLPSVKVIAGKVPDSFAKGMPEKIAMLHIDMNNVASERAALEALYDRVSPAGMMIFDDYGWVQYAAQKASADEFMRAREKKILELPTGQGLVVR